MRVNRCGASADIFPNIYRHLAAHCVQAANKTLRAMMEGGEAGAAAVAAELEGTRRELLDEEEVAGARFLAVLQVRVGGCRFMLFLACGVCC